MQCACAIFYVFCPDRQYFPTLSHKWHDLKKLLNIKCVFIFPATFVRNISHSKKKWARYDTNVYWSWCKVTDILVRFSWNLTFQDRFSKEKAQMWNLMKIRPAGTKSFHKDVQTDMTKLILAFRNFAKAPRIYWWAARYYYNISIPY